MSSGKEQSFLTQTNVFAAAFFVVLIFLLYQAALLLAPFSKALIWAGLIALILFPIYRRLAGLLGGRRGLAAGIMTAATFFVVIVPMVLLFSALTVQVAEIYRSASLSIQSGEWMATWERVKASRWGSFLAHPLIASLNVQDFVIKGLRDMSGGLASQVGEAIRNTLVMIVNFLLMLFALFFFFRDGGTYYEKIMSILPFRTKLKETITQKLRDTFSAVINGMFLIALFQGLMAGLGYAIFGVPFAVLWAFLTAFTALLPVGGATLVWVPASAYLFFTQSPLSGILLALWGLLLVSLPDNFLRPILIGRKANLPTFILFIAILGGLKVYGVFGILFGPIVVSLLTAFIAIYREEYAESRPRGRSSGRR